MDSVTLRDQTDDPGVTKHVSLHRQNVALKSALKRVKSVGSAHKSRVFFAPDTSGNEIVTPPRSTSLSRAKHMTGSTDSSAGSRLTFVDFLSDFKTSENPSEEGTRYQEQTASRSTSVAGSPALTLVDDANLIDIDHVKKFLDFAFDTTLETPLEGFDYDPNDRSKSVTYQPGEIIDCFAEEDLPPIQEKRRPSISERIDSLKNAVSASGKMHGLKEEVMRRIRKLQGISIFVSSMKEAIKKRHRNTSKSKILTSEQYEQFLVLNKMMEEKDPTNESDRSI